MTYLPSRFCTASLALVFCFSDSASAVDEPSYFILNGNPIAAKYAGGKLMRLPTQDAYDVGGLEDLEAVSALTKQSALKSLSARGMQIPVRISPPRVPEYGVPMFQISADGLTERRIEASVLAWSGPALFREVVLDRPGATVQLRRSLVSQSSKLLKPKLDFRLHKPVGRKLRIEGPVKVRDYGRTSIAPHLAFIDVTWRIKDLPDALVNRGIDSISPFFRVEYVFDTRTRKPVYRNTTNVGGIEDREMLIFKEPNGPLLMAVMINCSDGAEPFIIDLERESYGTEANSDVPEVPHCFPAQ